MSKQKMSWRILAIAIVSYLISCSLLLFCGLGSSLSELIFYPLFASVFFVIKGMLSLSPDKKRTACSVILGFCLSASFVIGRKINLWEEPYFEYFKLSDVFFLLCIGIFLSCCFDLLLHFVARKDFVIRPRKTGIGFYFIIFAVIVVAWLPYYFIYYPGLLSPDSFSHINQVLGITELSNHHPVAYTMLVKVFIRFGMKVKDITFGVGCFSLFQLLSFAALLSFCICWLRKKGFSTYVLVAATAFFALNPIIAAYAVTMWKDILFGGYMLLLVLFLYDVVDSRGELLKTAKGMLLLSLLILCVAFSRNNGKYIIVVVLAAVVLYAKKNYKRLLPLALSLVIVIYGIQGPGYNLLGIRSGNFAESVGIPIQQIGYTLSHDGVVTSEQKNALDKIMPTEKIAEEYIPYSPDFIKFNSSFDNDYLNAHKSEFLKTWAQMLPDNFVKYVKAYLMQTVGYYHIGTTNWVVFAPSEEYEQNIQQVDLIESSTGHDFKPQIRTMTAYLMKAPIVKNLFNISVSFWLTAFLCAVMIVKRRARYIIPLLPLLALWATLMVAAPTFCEFRYMFSFHVCLPVIFLMMFTKTKSL